MLLYCLRHPKQWLPTIAANVLVRFHLRQLLPHRSPTHPILSPLRQLLSMQTLPEYLTNLDASVFDTTLNPTLQVTTIPLFP